jgi:hypothetical protein
MSEIKQCSQQACQIGQLLREGLELVNVSLNLEMYERWGGGSDPVMNAALNDNSHYEKCRQNEVAAKAALKSALPDIRVEVATAYIFMLRHFLDKCEKAEYDTKTAQFVANKEIELWAQYQNSEIDFVDQNGYYINYEQPLFEAFFGKIIRDEAPRKYW